MKIEYIVILMLMILSSTSLFSQTWKITESGYAHVDYQRGKRSYANVEIKIGLLRHFSLGANLGISDLDIENSIGGAHLDIHLANFLDWEYIDLTMGYQQGLVWSNLRIGFQYYIREEFGFRLGTRLKLQDFNNPIIDKTVDEKLLFTAGIIIKGNYW